jgi:hypothetical protein
MARKRKYIVQKDTGWREVKRTVIGSDIPETTSFYYQIVFCSTKRGWGFRRKLSQRRFEREFGATGEIEILEPLALARLRRGPDVLNEFTGWAKEVFYLGCALCPNGWLFYCRCRYVSCIRSNHEGRFRCPVCGDDFELEWVERGKWSGRGVQAEPARDRVAEPKPERGKAAPEKEAARSALRKFFKS